MTSDVVLTAALRNNLISLQNTQSLVDTTQNRLATGKKINSALDGPQAFFASQALTNRASDLTRLLDSIGQSIQVIKAADNGVTALSKLIEQADSIAQSARDAIAAGQVEAKIVGNVDLSGNNAIDDLAGLTAAGGDNLVFSITDENGNTINLGTYGGAAAATATVTTANNTSIEDLIDSINNLHLQVNGAGNALGDQAIEASLDSGGHLQLRTLNGGDFRLVITAAATSDPADLAVASALGFSNVARLVPDGGAANSNSVEVSAISDVALNSFKLVSSAAGAVALRSDTLNNLRDAAFPAVLLFANLDAAGDDYQIGLNGGTVQNIDLTNAAATAVTIQDFIDDINANASLNTKIQAEFDDDTGVLSIRVIDASVTDVQVGVTNSVATANWGFGRNGAVAGNANDAARENIRLASAAADLAGYENDYDNLLDQIDSLVEDTGYRGTNLLNGDVLTTYFNEGRSSFLETTGSTFSAAGLGLDVANFSRTDSVDGAIDQARTALESVRSFGATLANNLSIIQTRESFTRDLINTLTEGSDKLVNADQNEEGAKLLALQTRQSLGVTALSLASQSQQSILRLF